MSAMNQNPKEAGWFYHAPAKRSTKEPVGAPPPSQIPGLGELNLLEKEEPREMVFRDTDTKYIRMAKMGGRKDLLSIKPNSQAKKEPVSYPRNDWFYLEDNALQDQANEPQAQWEFLLPEYMVHQYHGSAPDLQDGQIPDNTVTVPMRRAPYATDNAESQFSRDGQSMTDKTVKLPETRRPGYGVRSGKPPPKAPSAKSKPLSSQVQGMRPRLKNQPLPKEPEEPTNMAKLLSNTYEREWHDQLHKWQDKQSDGHEKSKVFAKPDAGNKNANRKGSADSRVSASGKDNQKDKEPKEPFKMNKFKNVPARINSHQTAEIMAAVGN